MKISATVLSRVFKIVQKKRFVKDILKSIGQSSGRALLVGGAVRDAFLNIPTKDLDFEVYGLTLDQLQIILESYGSVSLIGKSFGVLRLHGLDVDWSLPRQDSSGRHPVVSYDPYMSYEQAFIRRDLTINAMGIDMHTFDLIDPFGGMHDLENKILRSPDLNFFGQDPLRLLRVMQFIGRFDMQVDQNLSQVCSTMDMSKVSIERIDQEFTKLFIQAQRPSLGLQWLVQIDKFQEFLPGIVMSDALCVMIDQAALQVYQSDQEKLIMMWSLIVLSLDTTWHYELQQLTYQDVKKLIDFMHRLSRHDTLITQVAYLAAYSMMKFDTLADQQIKWLAVWLAPNLSIRLLSQCRAVRHSKSDAHIVLDRAEQLGVADQPELPLLTGKDFLDQAQGAQIGVLVKKAYQLQIDASIQDKQQLKDLTLST